MKRYIMLLLFLGTVLTSCKKNDDLVVEPEVQQKEEVEETPEEEVNIVVQNFMWQTMNAYYLWQAEINDLADNRFTTQSEYEAYLANNPVPEDFYVNTLLYADDRFSGYRKNYKELTNLLAGITKSNGLEFGLSLYGDGDDVFGYVHYIVANSNAATKDIDRGDIFVGVNGTPLNRDNYVDLLFGDQDTYTLNMADIIDNTIVPNSNEVVLTKEEGLEEDPLLISKVLEVGGQKIGYVMYNQFTGGSGEALNTAFGELKSAGVTDLVLDLRYNSGGKGYTANILASLIYGANTDNLFYKVRYNDKIQNALEPTDVEEYFMNTTGSAFGNTGAALNNLNLNRVYILATDNSASASELVMNGLVPYINVVHIGTTTVGKNQGSITFVDDLENGNFYDADREDKINPDNQWGLQPIVSTVENANGFSEYIDGLLPDIELEEDIANLGVLGDPNEPLLAMALQEITGISAKRSFTVEIPVDLISSSKLENQFRSALVLDKTPISPLFKSKSE